MILLVFSFYAYVCSNRFLLMTTESLLSAKKGLAGKKKLLFQGTIGLMVWAYLYYIGFTGRPMIDFSVINPISAHPYYIGAIGMFVLIQLILMGTSNAVKH